MTLSDQKIIDLAEQYPDVEGQKHYDTEDRLLRSLPPKFENGTYGMNDLTDIASWVYYLLGSHFKKNEFDDAKRVIERTQSTSDIEEKIDLLSTLSGVSTKTASAFLMFMNPEEYTMMSDRSIKSLRESGYTALSPMESPTASDYSKFLSDCRSAATKFDVSLRTLDRALVVYYDQVLS